jgi:NADH:ubiquinone oxidoreductase subunit 2 (subunit N)
VYERGWTWLVIVGVVATVVSVAYYLAVVRAMYASSAELRIAPAGGSPPRDWPLTTTVLACLAVAVATLVVPGPLVDLARDSLAFLSFPF